MMDAMFLKRIESVIKSQKFMQHLGAEIVAVEAGKVSLELKYDERWSQQKGSFDEGVVGVLANHAAGLAAATTMQDGRGCQVAEYKLNLLTQAKGDKLVAEGRVIKSGRNLVIAETDVYIFDQGKRVNCALLLATLVAVS